jgi:hypothetical protein
LEVPRLIEHGMVTSLDNPRGGVEIDNVEVGCCISKEDTGEVLLVQFTLLRASLLHANPGSETLEMGEVGLVAIPTFVGSGAGSRVHEAVVEVDCVE